MIPMNGFVQSLNIAVAAAITMHYATEQAKRVANEKYYLSKSEQQELYYRWMLKSARPLVQQLAKKRGDDQFQAE
jgi:tRNA (guanosine-2'-O-)-methyltransferase